MRLTDLAPASALVVAAHPDDAEFGCGGTLARWAAAGCVVHHLVLTDGAKGTWDLDVDPAVLAATRQDEQRAAAAALGAGGEVAFLGHVDGELDADVSTRRAVAAAVRRLRPEVVLGHDPWRRYRLHPDHRAAGWLVCDAVVMAREPHFEVASLPAWRPSHLLLWEADEPDVAVDVTDHTATKLDAILAHRSQWGPTMDVHDPDDAEALARFRRRVEERLATWGRAVGVARAEAFRILDL